MNRGRLAGFSIILTRPQNSSIKLKALLIRQGAKVASTPLIRIVPPRSWRGLDHGLQHLKKYVAVVFASGNAVDAFFDRARIRLRRRPRAPKIVAAIGPITAQRLIERGWRPTLIAQNHHARGLATVLQSSPSGDRVLIPRSERGRKELPQALLRQGWRVTLTNAYRLVTDHTGRRALLRELAGGADVCCFSSPSAVEAAFNDRRIRRAFSECRAVAIGPTTAAALRSRGINPIVADDANNRMIVEAVAKAVRRNS